ncbi:MULTISPECIES: class I SAM-dependent DNA methyltransferase [unclassified Streptomyces]|uniref:class I SAM-dependent DNA methyltransferase n=1 Tax=unclassified Streptomyces TaxID=2593676 RepID=UPI002E23D1D4|nr:class I SAM-dependent methyltransferase [Streptomyces sp. NBC_01023]
MTEPSCLSTIRASYDTVAVAYEELVRGHLAVSPYDRAMLAAFADQVRMDGGGPVADIGCGPGRVTAHLDTLGVEAFGVDLSQGMVDVARRTYPGLRFDVGSMTALDLADGSLGGLVAWYSIIHLPPELLPSVFAGFHRVLAPGGRLLLAFKAGDELRHLDHAYGHDLSLDVHWLPPHRVAGWLADAGFDVRAQLLREPDPQEKSPQAYLQATRGR